MNFAGGIRRGIMPKKKGLSVFPPPKTPLFPGGQLLWLILRQVGLHGKIRFRQVQRFLEFQRFGHSVGGASPFYAFISQRCPVGNIAKQRNDVCYNEWQQGVTRNPNATIATRRESYAVGHLVEELSV